MWPPGWEGSLRENGYMSMYMTEPLCCPSQTVTTLLIGYTSVQNKKLKKKQNRKKEKKWKNGPFPSQQQ